MGISSIKGFSELLITKYIPSFQENMTSEILFGNSLDLCQHFVNTTAKEHPELFHIK